MKARGKKNKGKRFERAIAKLMNSVFETNRFRRTPMSGGWDIKGDIVAIESDFDKKPAPLSEFVIELKCQEKSAIWKWIEQAKNQAGNKDWLLIFSKNREDSVACMDAHSFLWIMKELYLLRTKE